MKSKAFSLIKVFLGWPLSFLAIFFLLKIFTPHIEQIKIHLFHANIPIFLLSLFAFQLYFLCRVVLWQKLLGFLGHSVPLKPTAWYWSIAELNRYIPGNVWSIMSRGKTFSQFGISQKKLLFAWTLESLLVLLGSLTTSLLGITFLFFHMLPAFPLRNVLFFSTIAGVLLVDAAWVFHKRLKHISLLPKKITDLTLSSENAFLLLFYAALSFFFFGLGTYFSIQSLFFLPTQKLVEFVGLFSASFLLGYVSIFTPMGLGIRELVMSDGLLGFLSQQIVGFVAIFTRISLVISEIIFLVMAFLLHKIHVLSENKVVKHIENHRSEYFLGLMIVLYVAYFLTASFLRYTNFYTGRFDLGNMDQTVWNTMHGRIFQLTDPNGTNIMSRLGTHADFILILLAPFYLLWPDPQMLLLLQTVILSLGAVFVFLLGKAIVKSKKIGLILAFSYLLSPSIGFSNLYDFHAVTFATTFFLGAWYFLRQKKYAFTILFLFLAGLTKEEAWVVVGLFGIFFLFGTNKKLIGALLSTSAFAAFYLLIWKFIPMARGGQHFALSYYSDFGETPTAVIKNIFLSPNIILKLLLEKSRLMYFFDLLLPVGFLPLCAPLMLVFALPDVGINILSSNSQFREIFYQYTAVISPFLFISSVYAINALQKRIPRLNTTFFTWYIGIFAVTGAYFLGPFPGAVHQNVDMFLKPQPNRKEIAAFLQSIPKNVSVAATNNIGSHLSHRQQIFTIPVGIDKADVVVFLLNDPFAQPSLKAQKEMAQKLQHDPNYREIFSKDAFIVFEKENVHIEKPQ